MEVSVPTFGPSTIQTQRNMGMAPGSAPQPYYIIRADKPIPFALWVNTKFHGEANKKLTLDEWKKVRGTVRFGDQVGLNLPNYLVDKLEKGGLLSLADVEFDDLVNRGCMDEEQRVTCHTFWPKDVLIERSQLRRGMLVEYRYDDVSYPGSIAAISKDRKIVYLELFTPISYLDTPDSILSDEIEDSFHSTYTYQLGFGVYEALERASEESGRELIPDGKWDTEIQKDRRIYTLKDFMPLEVVKEVCGAYEQDEQKFCWWQSLILYVLPVNIGDTGGDWRPLPEKAVPTDAVISYEDEDEG